MSSRAYIVLDSMDGTPNQVVEHLQHKPGVMAAAGLVDGRQGMVVVVEAPDRQTLARSIMSVLGIVDSPGDGQRPAAT